RQLLEGLILFEQGPQASFRLSKLIKSTLLRCLVRAPSQQPCSVPKSVSSKMVIATLDDKLRLYGLPFARSGRRPSAWPARSFSGKAGRSDQRCQFVSKLHFGVAFDRRRKTDVVKQPAFVI